MENFMNKVSNICMSILLYGKDVQSISKPVIIDDKCSLIIRDSNNTPFVINISIQEICKAHDYLLDNLIIETMKEHALL